MIHKLLMFVRRIVAAIRHVRTGGKSTRTRARTRAAAPPKVCPTCHAPRPHSPDWRDHLEDELNHPTNRGRSTEEVLNRMPDQHDGR